MIGSTMICALSFCCFWHVDKTSAQQRKPSPGSEDDIEVIRNVYATDSDFEPLFRAIAEDITSSYVLAYYPQVEEWNEGRFHSIRVEVARGLTVRQSRPGYKSGDK
jgi:hypothetical protein